MPSERVYWLIMPLYVLIAAVGAAVLFFLLLSASVVRLRRKAGTNREITELIGQDQYEYTIIDVRERDDFSRSHMPAAKNIPHNTFDGGLPTENMFEKIFVYGPNGRIARRIARTLDRTGYFNVTCCGAFRGWKGPVVSDIAIEPDSEGSSS